MPEMSRSIAVAVVGSANVDLVVPVSRLPGPGETVLGGDHFRVAGGKGANQAVAAARLGCRVAMIGRVGDDDYGRRRLPGSASVVVTLGADGALVITDTDVKHVPALAVEAVAATGAGDAFCGALAEGLARGSSLGEAVRWAVRVAGVSTTRWGAQPAMPTRETVESQA